MTDIMQLLEKYGKPQNIPESELGAMGYRCVSHETENGIVYNIEKVGKPTRTMFGRKVAPFEKLAWHAQGGIMPKQHTPELARRIKELNRDLGHIVMDNLLGEIQFTMSDFCDYQFESYLTEYHDPPLYSHEDKISIADGMDLTPTWLLLFDTVVECYRAFESRIGSLGEYEGDRIPIDELHNILESLYRFRALLQDRHALQRTYEGLNYQRTMERPVNLKEYFSLPDDVPETVGGLVLYYLPGCLRDYYEFPGVIVDKVSQCTSLQQVKDMLSTVKKNDLKEYQLEQRIAEQIRNAATVDEKRALSTELKKAKEKTRERMNDVRDVRDGLSPYLPLTEVCLQKLKAIEDCLVGGISQQDKTYTLDGRPDRALDHDPGKVSGDCTEGKPLPFNIRDDLHNVKVYSPDHRYVGNIYLYDTTELTDENPRRVWHLDAIQVPQYLDWKESVKSLVEVISAEAATQGIDVITVNTEAKAISNYDYVADAVIKLHEQSGSESTVIRLFSDTLFNDDAHSALQLDDTQRILWQREKRE